MISKLPVPSRRPTVPLLTLAVGVALVHWLAWEQVAQAQPLTLPGAGSATLPVQVRTLVADTALHETAVHDTTSPDTTSPDTRPHDTAAAASLPTEPPRTAERPDTLPPVVATTPLDAAPAPADPHVAPSAHPSDTALSPTEARAEHTAAFQAPTAASAHPPTADATLALEPAVLVAAPSFSAATARVTPQLLPVADVNPSDVPVYRTQLPPAMTLGYELQYGRWTGSGELLWRPTAQGYEATLEGRVAALRVITLKSQGLIDNAGLAPVRYTDARRGRGEQAANFQRKAGKITFSGHDAEFALLPGSQDRLSWMLQLAAIASAEPKRVAPGGRIAMYVVGARADADVWAFHVEGVEDVSTPEGKVKTVKLLREPRKPHDTRVEVWLAPSLHYLPVRAKQTTDNSSWDLQLRSTQPAT